VVKRRAFGLASILIVLVVSMAGLLWLARAPAPKPETEAMNAGGERSPTVARPESPPALTLSPRQPPAAMPVGRDRDEYARAKAKIADCWAAMKCPPGSTCWLGDDGSLGCYRSNCSSALEAGEQCGSGRTCETIDRARGIRRCVAAGRVSEGGLCADPEFAGLEASCAAGLLCWRNHCRRLCRQDDECSGACAKVNAADAICVPACKSEQDCRSGYSCLAVSPSTVPICVRPLPAIGHGCLPDRAGVRSCGVGMACDFALAQDLLLSACRPVCDDRTPCPTGSSCWTSGPAGGVCVRSCDPAGADCAGQESCAALDAGGQRWGCRLLPHADRPGVPLERSRGHFSDPLAHAP
jgi:hypothetical protein